MNSPMHNNESHVTVITIQNLNQFYQSFDLEKIKNILLFILLSTFTVVSMFAEGSKELAPNSQTTISGSTDTPNDIAALNIGNSQYKNFAEYNVSDDNARLFIHISDPTTESIYLGFSAGHGNLYSSNTSTQTGFPRVPINEITYRYYVKDPSGNIVFTSPIINGSSANISTWQQAVNGPNMAGVTDGYDPVLVPSDSLTQTGNLAAGDYYIEFELLNEPESNKFLLIDYWDITVVNNSLPKTGRVWSKNWGLFAINDYDFPNRPFNGAFYVCAPDPANLDAS